MMQDCVMYLHWYARDVTLKAVASSEVSLECEQEMVYGARFRLYSR